MRLIRSALIPGQRSKLLGIGGAIACSLVLGCGGSSYDGPPRHSLQGNVTYNGQAVPSGSISFEPDTSKGGKGPGLMTEIRDGHYTTPSDRGVVSGATIVHITGNDGKVSATSESGTPLFEEFITSVDLPDTETTHDFEVPVKKK